MATTFDITGRINAVVSSGSLRMLKKLQTELRATAKTLLQMGETTTASALGHTAMALDRVAGAAGKVTDGAKKAAASTDAVTKKMGKLRGESERQTAIAKEVGAGWKLNVVESQALTKTVGLLGKKYTYATNMQKEWVPALKTALGEINKQKAALVASGRAITTHVSSQELFARTNTKLASGLHTVSGKLTDYDGAMAKSLGRSPAFRREVDGIAKAVGKQGESFKSQFAALTKADDLWRKHVTNLHRAGEVTTKQAKKMYASYDHLRMPLSDLQARLKGVTQKTSLFSRAMSSLVVHLKSFAAYAAAASMITAVAGMFGLATRAIIKYDQALHDLQAITRATNDEVVLMGEKIREIGRTTKFSASEVAVAMRTLGQAGFTATEAIASIGAVADLATGTLTSMKTVVDLITTAIRAFDLKTTETTRVADIFANAVNRSKLTIDKLRIAFNYIGPIAAKIGITLEETATTTMMLANAGIRASTIGTGLRRTFQQLIEPTKELKAAIEAAGYTVEDFNPQMNDMRDIIRRLTEIVPDAEAAFRMFSLRSSAAVAALSSQGVASFDALHSAVLRSGTAAEMAEKQIEGLGIIFKQAMDKAHDLALAFGEAGVSGALRILGKGLQMLFDGLRFLVESGIVEAIVKVGVLTAAFYSIAKAWAAIQMAQWAITLKLLITQLGLAGAATEGFGMALASLQTGFGPLLILAATLYGAYKLFTVLLSTEVKKVNTEYIDDLDEIHKKELERLEGIKRLVSIIRDEMETDRGRSNALTELSKKTAGFNLIIDEGTGKVEDLTGSILTHKDALDEAAASFGDYNEKIKLEKLIAQTKLFEDAGDALEALAPKMMYLKERAGELGEQTEITGKQAALSFLGWNSAMVWAAKQLKIVQRGAEALEAQQAEAHEKRVKAAISFGEITQEVWKDYMLRAGATAEEVADLFTNSEEKITAAHVEAYLRIQLAREDMTKEEKKELEKHIESIIALFDKVNNITARRLERDLRGIRENYSEREKIITEFYDSDILYMRKKAGFESDTYGKIIGLIRRYSIERLALLDKSYEEEKALIESYNLDMEDTQERITELKKKHANRRLKIEQKIAASIVVLAEEQLEVLAETYERASTAYDESVDRRIDSIDRCYDYEKTKAELQLKDAEVLAEKLVDLESQRFDEIITLGEQAKNDRLANEGSYHRQQIELVESAQRSLADQYEEDNEEYIKKEKELNEKLVEISRASTEKRLDILNSWSNYLTDRYNEAIGNTRGYANKIIEIENEIRDVRKKAADEIASVHESTQDKIHRIHKAGLSERAKIYWDWHIAQTKMLEADRLMAEGGTEEAIKQARDLYKDAQDIFTDLGIKAHEAKKAGEDIGISHNTAAKMVAKAGDKIIKTYVKERDLSIEAKNAEVEVAKQAQKSWADLAREIQTRIGGIQSDIADLVGGMGELISTIGSLEDKEVSVGANEAVLRTSIKLVKGLWTNICALKDKTVTITTRHVEAKQGGGPVGAFARGGKLPGFGGGDRVRALLEAGEYVINKNAVRKYGAAMFSAYNSMATPVLSAMKNPLKFAFGGFVGLKPAGLMGGPSGGNFSQVDKSIAGLSKAITALNLASLSIANEGKPAKMRRKGSETYEDFIERQRETEGMWNPLGSDEYKISFPSILKNIVSELREDLKGVQGEDKGIIQEIIGLLVPSGIGSGAITDRLSNRKLPDAGDVDSVVLNLEKEKADLIQKKEELTIYLEDLKKVREFYISVRLLMSELSSLTTKERPYNFTTNEPCWDYREKIAGIQRAYTNAKPILRGSGLDLSNMDSVFNDYLVKQQKLASYQVGNSIRCIEEGYAGVTTSHKISKDVRISRFDGKGKLPCWFQFPIDVCIASHGNMMGRSANDLELGMMDESISSKLEFSKTNLAARVKLEDQKRELLRGLNKHGIESSLRSEAASIEKDLTYEPMAVPDVGPVQAALKGFAEGQEKGLDLSNVEKLRMKYQELANIYFASLPKFATGGFVDNILARLSPGEFVLKAEAVKQLGVPFLNVLNNFKAPIPAFAGGGVVESAPSMSAASIPSVQTRDVHLHVNITGAGEITEKQVRKWILPAVNKIRRLES